MINANVLENQLQDVVTRLIEEANDLEIKRFHLFNFLNNNENRNLIGEEQVKLMNDQLNIMNDYLQILNKRINYIKNEANKN